jgi:hypothetical protein
VKSNSQLTAPPAVSVLGEQSNEERELPSVFEIDVPLFLVFRVLDRVTVVVAALPFREAVMVAVSLLVLTERAVALKLDIVALAGTLTEAGTESEALLLASVTVDPPAGAIAESVTLHVVLVFMARLLGLQARLETLTGASRLMAAVFEVLPIVAVTVAV